MSKRSKKRRQVRKKPAAPLQYSTGLQIHVKPGVTDPDFPDLPLGGWSGKIIDVDGKNAETLRNLIAAAGDPELKAACRVALAGALRDQATAAPDRAPELLREASAALNEVVNDKSTPRPLLAAALYSLAGVNESVGKFTVAPALRTMSPKSRPMDSQWARSRS